MDKAKRVGRQCIALALVLSMMVSCVPAGITGKGTVDQKMMISESSRMIDVAYQDVRDILIESGEYTEAEFDSHGKLDGETVTRSLMTDGGEAYVEFLYSSDKFRSVEEVLSAAEKILDSSSMENLRKDAREVEEKLMANGERIARDLNENQKEEFYNDLRTMVVKSVVLLTAAVVYAFIPNVVFWGKVTAATAVSVAAGVMASTLISIVEWSDKDVELTDSTFSDWLKNVTLDPFTDWALAQGIINAQAAVTESPVTAALILGVFAIYNVIDSAKEMLEKYNWAV